MRTLLNEWKDYVLEEYSFAGFAPGALVLDLGCGEGTQLKELHERGCRAIGIDLDRKSISNCWNWSLRVLHGSAEQIPVKNASVDGLVCKVVIPYTDEVRVLNEISRVLKPGAIANLCYHGAGYYIRYLLLSPSWRFRFYGLRTLVNTFFYVVTGQRLPGFFGDTIYQSRQRLRKYYLKNGLKLLRDSPTKTFLGLPVFIYHSIQKTTESINPYDC